MCHQFLLHAGCNRILDCSQKCLWGSKIYTFFSKIFDSSTLLQSEWRTPFWQNVAQDPAKSAVQMAARAMRGSLSEQHWGLASVLSMQRLGEVAPLDRWPWQIFIFHWPHRMGIVSRNPWTSRLMLITQAALFRCWMDSGRNLISPPLRIAKVAVS